MERDKLVALIVLVAVLSGLFVIFVGIPAVQTHFHYERALHADETKHVIVRFDRSFPDPVLVNVSFVEDPTLMYRIDVVQEIPGPQHRLQNTLTSGDISNILVNIDGIGDSRVSSIEVVLGTGTSYDLIFLGSKMNVTVAYDNNAVISPRPNDGDTTDIIADCDTLTFILTEDVQFNSTGLTINVDSSTNIRVAIDLPDGMNGKLDCKGTTDVALYTDGWSPHNVPGTYVVYRTVSTSEPLIDIIYGGMGYVIGFLSS